MNNNSHGLSIKIVMVYSWLKKNLTGHCMISTQVLLSLPLRRLWDMLIAKCAPKFRGDG